MKAYFKLFLLFMILISPSLGISLNQKYPSYNYVFSEFDVDKSYIYSSEFTNFVRKNEKGLRSFYEHSLKRGKKVLPTMKGLLSGKGVSDLFIYLSMVESGFSSKALSPKKAAGLWQFMPETAKNYKLKVSKDKDERYNTASSTKAAIKYLNKLHRQFGKWYIAAMAYNCGEGCVERAIKKAGTNDISVLTNDRLKYLPKETRDYIKKILLVAMIGENVNQGYASMGSNIDVTTANVEVSGGTNIKSLAKLLKTSYKTLKKMNPNIKGSKLPRKRRRYIIRIPIDKIYAFYLRYEFSEDKQVPKSDLLSHIVKLGETLLNIANRYETSPREIMFTNHLKEEYLMVGQLLVIPVTKKVFKYYTKK